MGTKYIRENLIVKPFPRIFRSVIKTDHTAKILYKSKRTMRPPRNVPYIVDNLWEWKRPMQYPSRRFSTFASPQQHLCKKSGPTGGTVFIVEFKGGFKLCQLISWEDSKFHRECQSLINLLQDKIKQNSYKKKRPYRDVLKKLWTPCLTKEEINELFEKVEILRDIRDEIYNAINYWKDVRLIRNVNHIPDKVGELFFETIDGYYLRRCVLDEPPAPGIPAADV